MRRGGTKKSVLLLMANDDLLSPSSSSSEESPQSKNVNTFSPPRCDTSMQQQQAHHDLLKMTTTTTTSRRRFRSKSLEKTQRQRRSRSKSLEQTQRSSRSKSLEKHPITSTTSNGISRANTDNGGGRAPSNTTSNLMMATNKKSDEANKESFYHSYEEAKKRHSIRSRSTSRSSRSSPARRREGEAVRNSLKNIISVDILGNTTTTTTSAEENSPLSTKQRTRVSLSSTRNSSCSKNQQDCKKDKKKKKESENSISKTAARSSFPSPGLRHQKGTASGGTTTYPRRRSPCRLSSSNDYGSPVLSSPTSSPMMVPRKHQEANITSNVADTSGGGAYPERKKSSEKESTPTRRTTTRASSRERESSLVHTTTIEENKVSNTSCSTSRIIRSDGFTSNKERKRENAGQSGGQTSNPNHSSIRRNERRARSKERKNQNVETSIDNIPTTRRRRSSSGTNLQRRSNSGKEGSGGRAAGRPRPQERILKDKSSIMDQALERSNKKDTSTNGICAAQEEGCIDLTPTTYKSNNDEVLVVSVLEIESPCSRSPKCLNHEVVGRSRHSVPVTKNTLSSNDVCKIATMERPSSSSNNSGERIEEQHNNIVVQGQEHGTNDDKAYKGNNHVLVGKDDKLCYNKENNSMGLVGSKSDAATMLQQEDEKLQQTNKKKYRIISFKPAVTNNFPTSEDLMGSNLPKESQQGRDPAFDDFSRISFASIKEWDCSRKQEKKKMEKEQQKTYCGDKDDLPKFQESILNPDSKEDYGSIFVTTDASVVSEITFLESSALAKVRSLKRTTSLDKGIRCGDSSRRKSNKQVLRRSTSERCKKIKYISKVDTKNVTYNNNV